MLAQKVYKIGRFRLSRAEKRTSNQQVDYFYFPANLANLKSTAFQLTGCFQRTCRTPNHPWRTSSCLWSRSRRRAWPGSWPRPNHYPCPCRSSSPPGMWYLCTRTRSSIPSCGIPPRSGGLLPLGRRIHIPNCKL